MNKRKLLITVTGVVIIGVLAGTLLYYRLNDEPYALMTIKRGDIAQEISASGKVESPIKIDLRFKNSGKLVFLNAKVGEKVLTGQLLAKQDTAQLDAQVLEMQAGIDLQKAKLSQLQGGASPEDIMVSESAVQSAEQALLDSQKNLIDKINGAYTKSDDAIRGKSDQLFDNPQTNPQLVFVFPYNAQLETDVEEERVLIESILNAWEDELAEFSFDDNLLLAFELADKNLNRIKSFLSSEALMVNALSPSSRFTQTTIDKWRADISTARTNIDVAISNILSAWENLKIKEAALKAAQNQLILKKAPLRSFDVAVYQAQISQAEASLERIEAQRRDLMIYAPSSSIITYVNGEVGEIVGLDTPIVSLAVGDILQVKLNIIEDKIVNVRVGQKARITFDAIRNQEFGGKVAAVDPAETIIGGAVYYQTIINLDEADERIRSGMTANVWVKTAISENTLFVPASAIQINDNKTIVRVWEGKRAVEKEIVTGIKNDAGMIEIVFGLSEGEKVILIDGK